ncbi:hypothetical protein EV132_111151 [Rhizobium sullae]|uniref:Uncharacterized protein n=1 Tax=Rhizobium sullae TaxID=50338 RepID=A0A4R3PYF3_RHISU|nr:hypothetical protein EV132_111151 [Rhizobium sullae]
MVSTAIKDSISSAALFNAVEIASAPFHLPCSSPSFLPIRH